MKTETATIDQVVDKHTLPCVLIQRQKRLAKELLPCERVGVSWPLTVAGRVSDELAALYPLIDIDSILLMRHPKRYAGLPAPRFATYSPEDGWCKFEISLRPENTSAGSKCFSRTADERWGKAVQKEVARKIGNRLKLAAVTLVMTAVLVATVGALGWAGVIAPICCLIAALMWLASHDVTLTTSFVGHIPPEARDVIRNARELFGESLIIVQEVREWNASVKYVGDPLIVGCHDGVAYLVGRFDTTTLEEYVAREFTEGV